MNFLRNSLLSGLIFISFSVSAQILNDSAQNVYGPHSTRFFIEDDVLNSIDTLYYLDTVLRAFHRYTFPQRYDNQYQDLGNKATAIQPLFYKSPSNIGFRSGFGAYDLYWDDLVDMRFYDTRSPYSRFHYVQGGRGVSYLEAELSRNVVEGWNLGFTFNRFTSNPQIDFSPRPLNQEAEHNSYSGYTAYKTKNGKYQVNAYFRRMYHKVSETGGVQLILPDSGVLDGQYRDENGSFSVRQFFEDYTAHRKNLLSAKSSDLRINYHVYHQYRFSDLLGVYHLFDHHSQTVGFEDRSSPYNHLFYKIYQGHANYIDTTVTPKEVTKFKIYRNEIGLKGAINQFKYRFFLRRRNIFVDNHYLFDLNWQIEDIAGAAVAFRFSERSVLHFNGEILGNSTMDNEARDYLVNFDFENRYLNLIYKRMRYSPTYLQENYFGNHHSWENKFTSPVSDDLILSTRLGLGFLEFIPRIKFSRVSGYIFYTNSDNGSGENEEGKLRPEQETAGFEIISPGVDLNLKLGMFRFKNNITYNKVAKGSPIRLPKLVVNSLLYYERPITKRGHFLQFGFDLQWKDAYHADRYMPSIQQFYLQRDLTNSANSLINQYVVIDFYGAMKINRTRVFARLSNLSQGLFGNPNGYLVRPDYYGFQRVLDVGVHWMFFD